MKTVLVLLAVFVVVWADIKKDPTTSEKLPGAKPEQADGAGAGAGAGKEICGKLGNDLKKINNFCECIKRENPVLVPKLQQAGTCLPGTGTIGEKVLEACRNQKPDPKVSACLGPFLPLLSQYVLENQDQKQKKPSECAKLLK